jgi:ribonuclease P protein component
LNRRFRLTRSTDFKRVRRSGKSYAHPLLVLIARSNEHETSRFAVAAGRSVGNAVERNRAKRLLREGLRPLIPTIAPGWDVIILARRSITQATLQESQRALITLLSQARLMKENHDQ